MLGESVICLDYYLSFATPYWKINMLRILLTAVTLISLLSTSTSFAKENFDNCLKYSDIEYKQLLIGRWENPWVWPSNTTTNIHSITYTDAHDSSEKILKVHDVYRSIYPNGKESESSRIHDYYIKIKNGSFYYMNGNKSYDIVCMSSDKLVTGSWFGSMLAGVGGYVKSEYYRK